MDTRETATGAADRLDRSSERALHEQLTDRLVTIIRQIGRGGRLPSEEELMERHGVSRTTVRRALHDLAERGLLIRRQGKGTFVAGPHIVHKLDRLAPFVETLSTASGPHQGTLLDFRWSSGPLRPQVFESSVDRTLAFRRLYSSAQTPHALAHVIMPDWVASTVTRADVDAHPVYHLLRRVLGINLQRADVSVSCRPAGRAVAKHLKISPSAPTLIMRRVTYDEQDRAVEFTTHYLRWDIYELRLRIPSDDLRTARQISRAGGELSFIAGPNRYRRAVEHE